MSDEEKDGVPEAIRSGEIVELPSDFARAVVLFRQVPVQIVRKIHAQPVALVATS